MKPLRCIVVSSLIALSGCAGFRGGFASFRCVGEPASGSGIPTTPFELRQLHEIHLPGVKLDVSLNNASWTYEYEGALYGVPTHIDLEQTSRHVETDRLQLSLTVKRRQPGFSLDPRAIVVGIDERRIGAVAM